MHVIHINHVSTFSLFLDNAQFKAHKSSIPHKRSLDTGNFNVQGFGFTAANLFCYACRVYIHVLVDDERLECHVNWVVVSFSLSWDNMFESVKTHSRGFMLIICVLPTSWLLYSSNLFDWGVFLFFLIEFFYSLFYFVRIFLL